MEYSLRGSILPVVDMELKEGESVFTESGGMAWMSENMKMETNTGGGLMKGIRRAMAGESLFINKYTCSAGTGIISFCSEFPGRVIPFDLKENQSIICQRDAFMVASNTVNLDMEFTKRMGVGFFGGEGFFLQKLTGPGKAFIELDGEITEYELEEGQSLNVSTGYIGAFEPSVKYEITRVKGAKNMLFGGEGFFLAKLTGPGKVWLQSMPLSSLVRKIMSRMPARK